MPDFTRIKLCLSDKTALLTTIDSGTAHRRAAQFLSRLVQFVVSLASGVEFSTLTLSEKIGHT